MAARSADGYAACARLLSLAPSRDDVHLLVSALDKDLSGPPLAEVPAPLVESVARLWQQDGAVQADDGQGDRQRLRAISALHDRQADQDGIGESAGKADRNALARPVAEQLSVALG